MKRLYCLLLSSIAIQANADILITEYIEGGGYNKAIEITNTGDSNIALGEEGYTLSLFTNGANEAKTISNLYGILVPNSSLVIHNKGLSTSSQYPSPLGLADNGVINHNGDDAYVLKKGDVVVDSIGQVGVDPGSYWGTSEHNTKDHTLRRAEGNTVGDTDPSDVYDPNQGQWVFHDKDTLDGLGCSGIATCTGDEPKPLTEGDEPPPDTCIFTSCSEIIKVHQRSDYVESVYYTKANAAFDSDVASFRAALHQDIKLDHTQLTYNQVWTALIKTDEDPSNPDNIILLYTGKSIAKTENASVMGNSADSWNREHVWSKSHGFPDSSQLGYTDIHHLRPADASINSTRSNYDFDDGGEAVYDGDTLTENYLVSGTSWEPRNEVKGDVARMMFYMDVRYELDSDTDMPDLQLVDNVNTEGEEFGKLCALYEWHVNDPADAYEIERNELIYEFQGNRNPFIDHPEWVEKVFADKCAEVVLPTVEVSAVTVNENQSVTLTATVNVDGLSFTWNQDSGTSVTLSSIDTETVTFTAPSVSATETLTFTVVVVDEQNNEATTSVNVTVNDVPVVIEPPKKKKSGGSTDLFVLFLIISCFYKRTFTLKK